MKTSDFYYDLPQELIAQTPLARRDASRMLCLDRRGGAVTHRSFSDLPELLRPGDCLVLNDSRVIPARLLGKADGRPVELLLLRDEGDGLWDCIARPGKRARPGTRLSFRGGCEGAETLTAEVESVDGAGNRHVRFFYDGVFLEILSRLGETPLPPYIRTRLDDPERYQTVYARAAGSAAAPTAGLHFTEEILQGIAARGVAVARLTLHRHQRSSHHAGPPTGGDA